MNHDHASIEDADLVTDPPMTALTDQTTVRPPDEGAQATTGSNEHLSLHGLGQGSNQPGSVPGRTIVQHDPHDLVSADIVRLPSHCETSHLYKLVGQSNLDSPTR